MSKLFYGVEGVAKNIDLVKLILGIRKIFGTSVIKSREILDDITNGGFDGPINEEDYEKLNSILDELTHREVKIVSQEFALYGEYPIDVDRLTQAKKWYNKQTPENQSFIDILIRDKVENELKTEKIDYIQLVKENYPDEEFVYPTDLADAIIGIDSEHYRFILSKNKTIEIYISRDGMSYDEAIDYLYYNPIRATEYLENGPIWVDDII